MGSNRAKKNIRTLRVRRSLLVLGLIAGLVGALPVAASGYECEDQRLHTLTVKMRPLQASYQPGDTAEVLVTVTRELPQVRNNWSFVSSRPAEDVSVTLGLFVQDFAFIGRGITGEQGTALIAVKIRRNSPSGSAEGYAYAWKDAVDEPCSRLGEDGKITKRDFIRIDEA